MTHLVNAHNIKNKKGLVNLSRNEIMKISILMKIERTND